MIKSLILFIFFIFCQISLADPTSVMLDNVETLIHARTRHLQNIKETLQDPDNTKEEQVEYLTTYLLDKGTIERIGVNELTDEITKYIDSMVFLYTIADMLLNNARIHPNFDNKELLQLYIYFHLMSIQSHQIETHAFFASHEDFKESHFIIPVVNELKGYSPALSNMAELLDSYFEVKAFEIRNGSGNSLKSIKLSMVVREVKIRKTIDNLNTKFQEMLKYRQGLAPAQQATLDEKFGNTLDQLLTLREKVDTLLSIGPDLYFRGEYVILTEELLASGFIGRSSRTEEETNQLLVTNFSYRFNAVYNLLNYRLAMDQAYTTFMPKEKSTASVSPAAASTKKSPKKKLQKKKKSKNKKTPITDERLSDCPMPEGASSSGSCSSSTSTVVPDADVLIDATKEELEENESDSSDDMIEPILEQQLFSPEVWREEDFYDLLKIWKNTLHAKFFVNGKPWIPKRGKGGFTLEIKYHSVTGKPAILFCHAPHAAQDKNRKIWTGWRKLMIESLQEAGYLVR